MGRLFGTDGVRGIAGEFLSASLAERIGHAVATVLFREKAVHPTVLVGYDTRESSEMLAAAVSAGLASAGADVTILGVVTTPAVAYLVRHRKAGAGVMISASHNSYEYNGIKVFSESGHKLPDEVEEEIEALIDDEAESKRTGSAWEAKVKTAGSGGEKGTGIGRIRIARNANREYLAYLTSVISTDLSGLHIALDCANGSASATARKLFSSLGAKCEILSSSPDGKNINENCGSTHIEALAAYVRQHKLDGGAAFDGDADRCLLVDEKGELIDGDQMMAFLSLDMKERGVLKKNTVVGTIMTNYGFSKFCEENGLTFIPAKVGDRYVLEALELEGLSFGGEQSGHLIFRDLATTGDGQLTAAEVFALAVRKKASLSSLAKAMRRYPQHLENLRISGDAKTAIYTDKKIKQLLLDAEKELAGKGRLVIRPSGTEPLLRIMAEGESETLVRSVVERVKNGISERLLSMK